MAITERALWTLIHGMGFGALYLLACSGALIEIYRLTTPSTPFPTPPTQQRFLNIYLITMVVVAWGAFLGGAYILYPWSRPPPPLGAADLSMFPQKLLMFDPATSG